MFNELPDEVVELVLSFVPWPWLPRARLVCTRWLRALGTPHFALLWASRPWPDTLWLLRHATHTAFHLSSRLSIPLPRTPHPFSMLASCHVGILVTSSTALLSLIASPRHPPSPLPPPLRISSLLHVGIAALLRSQSRPQPFHVIAHGTSADASSHHVELYDSSRAAWAPLPRPPSFPDRSSRNHPTRGTQDFVYWNGMFCILAAERVLTYSPRGAAWDAIELPTRPRIWDARFVTLHVIGGRLILEGNFQEQGDFQKRYPLRVGMLEFEAGPGAWKEVAFMPKGLSERLCKEHAHPAHSFYTAHTDPRCHTLCFAPFPSTQEEDLVLFHLVDSTWTCVSISHKGRASPIRPPSIPSFKGLTYQLTS